jgi:hypothetical protein
MELEGQGFASATGLRFMSYSSTVTKQFLYAASYGQVKLFVVLQARTTPPCVQTRRALICCCNFSDSCGGGMCHNARAVAKLGNTKGAWVNLNSGEKLQVKANYYYSTSAAVRVAARVCTRLPRMTNQGDRSKHGDWRRDRHGWGYTFTIQGSQVVNPESLVWSSGAFGGRVASCSAAQRCRSSRPTGRYQGLNPDEASAPGSTRPFQYGRISRCTIRFRYKIFRFFLIEFCLPALQQPHGTCAVSPVAR